VLTSINRPRIPRPVALATAVVAACTLAVFLNEWLVRAAPVPIAWSLHKLRVAFMQWGMVTAVYYFIERAAVRAAQLRKAELQRQRLEAQMFEARLQVLQAQVEPHFLFNTLAHLQRLYQTDPARGRSMLDSFCGYLCAALPHMRGNCSTVRREVELARAYLDTQRVRMGRRLRFEIAVPNALATAAFPPMMLLPLVENAIKHGLSPLREGGTVKIAVASDADTLRLSVIDTGAGLSAVELAGGNGVGLSNIRSRMAALYGDRAHFKLSRHVPRGVIATLDVPLRFPSAGDAGVRGGRDWGRVSASRPD
jgi:sensor histidine kinase YesM